MFKYLFALLCVTAFKTPLPISLFFLKPFIFGVSLVCLIVLVVTDWRLNRLYWSSTIFAILALAMIAIAGARGYFPDDRSLVYLLTTAGVICVAPFMRAMSPNDLHNLVRALCYFIASLIILTLVTQAVDGSVFGNIAYRMATPSIFYEDYSLIFGLTAVLAFSKGREKNNFFAYCAGFVCLLLSLYMGSRGESFFAVFTCVVMARKWVIVAFSVLGSLIITVFPSSLDYVMEFSAVQRTLWALGVHNYGMRDVLFEHAIGLLNNIDIFLFGGGANYFQRSYPAFFGYFPHNILLEAMDTFGVIAGAYFGYIFLQHVAWFLIYSIRDVQNKDLLTLSGMIAYLALLAMKSGSMWDGWLLYFLVLVHPQTRFWLGARSRTSSSCWDDARGHGRPVGGRRGHDIERAGIYGQSTNVTRKRASLT